jgi:hypothetical protein
LDLLSFLMNIERWLRQLVRSLVLTLVRSMVRLLARVLGLVTLIMITLVVVSLVLMTLVLVTLVLVSLVLVSLVLVSLILSLILTSSVIITTSVVVTICTLVVIVVTSWSSLRIFIGTSFMSSLMLILLLTSITRTLMVISLAKHWPIVIVSGMIVFVPVFVDCVHASINVQESFNHANSVFTLEEATLYMVNLKFFYFALRQDCLVEKSAVVALVGWVLIQMHNCLIAFNNYCHVAIDYLFNFLTKVQCVVSSNLT